MMGHLEPPGWKWTLFYDNVAITRELFLDQRCIYQLRVNKSRYNILLGFAAVTLSPNSNQDSFIPICPAWQWAEPGTRLGQSGPGIRGRWPIRGGACVPWPVEAWWLVSRLLSWSQWNSLCCAIHTRPQLIQFRLIERRYKSDFL